MRKALNLSEAFAASEQTSAVFDASISNFSFRRKQRPSASLPFPLPLPSPSLLSPPFHLPLPKRHTLYF